ncbi:MAG: hypothetical protein NC827_07210 [Candidatus Omnitrophica bacterium]|nr:hypothetical protein [Candidatus Omnitrophota bacterium]MCM8803079.1 hypothetical protein [Candidatus Omnitrophota bacterium]
MEGFCSNTFTPFIDTSPSAKPEERYKAVAEGRVDDKPVLFAFVSADGIHWQ